MSEVEYMETHNTELSKEDGLVLSSRCFAVALGHLLHETEAILVELKQNEDYPTEPYGKFSIYKDDGRIVVSKWTEEDEKQIPFKNGAGLTFKK